MTIKPIASGSQRRCGEDLSILGLAPPARIGFKGVIRAHLALDAYFGSEVNLVMAAP
jgi:hypothetical protein